MKLLNRGLALAVMGAGLAAVPTLGMQATAAPSAEPSLLSQLRDQAQGSVAVTKEAATGKAGFVRTNGDLLPAEAATDATSASAKADAYLDKFAGVLGARSSELTQQRRRTRTRCGWTVTYTQAYEGIPVFGSGLKANLDKQGDLTSVAGYAAPDLSLSTTPRDQRRSTPARPRSAIVKEFPPTSADAAAGRHLRPARRRGRTSSSTARARSRARHGDAVLAWQVDVTNVTKKSGSIHDVLFLDATSLKPVNRYSTHPRRARPRALDRHRRRRHPRRRQRRRARAGVEGGRRRSRAPSTRTSRTCSSSSEETYNLYDNMFGRDSYDGAGARMITVHNRSDRCPNASWNGTFASYCPGVYDDDTVAHEWSHAYTEYTSGLIYQWQSGALNESMSDVFGETAGPGQRPRGRGRGRPLRQASRRPVLQPLPRTAAAHHQLALDDRQGLPHRRRLVRQAAHGHRDHR